MLQTNPRRQAVLDLYAALRAQDSQRIGELLVAEPVWDITPGAPGGRVYRGLSEVFGEFYPALARLFQLRAPNPERFLITDNEVVVLGHCQIAREAEGVPTTVRFVHVWSFAGEKISGLWHSADTQMMARALLDPHTGA